MNNKDSFKFKSKEDQMEESHEIILPRKKRKIIPVEKEKPHEIVDATNIDGFLIVEVDSSYVAYMSELKQKEEIINEKLQKLQEYDEELTAKAALIEKENREKESKLQKREDEFYEQLFDVKVYQKQIAEKNEEIERLRQTIFSQQLMLKTQLPLDKPERVTASTQTHTSIAATANVINLTVDQKLPPKFQWPMPPITLNEADRRYLDIIRQAAKK